MRFVLEKDHLDSSGGSSQPYNSFELVIGACSSACFRAKSGALTTSCLACLALYPRSSLGNSTIAKISRFLPLPSEKMY